MTVMSIFKETNNNKKTQKIKTSVHTHYFADVLGSDDAALFKGGKGTEKEEWFC